MRVENVIVPMRDGRTGACVACPDKTLHMAMKDRRVQKEVNDLLERKPSPNPLVTIHEYPGADHAFARYGGLTYSKPEADSALAITLDMFYKHLD